MVDIRISVDGGVAEVEENNTNTNVIIIDWDEEQEFDTVYDGFIDQNKDSLIVCGEGGVFEIVHCPENIEAELIDYDDLDDE